jgi:hypothetical protein
MAPLCLYSSYTPPLLFLFGFRKGKEKAKKTNCIPNDWPLRGQFPAYGWPDLPYCLPEIRPGNGQKPGNQKPGKGQVKAFQVL